MFGERKLKIAEKSKKFLAKFHWKRKWLEKLEFFLVKKCQYVAIYGEDIVEVWGNFLEEFNCEKQDFFF